MIDRPDEEKQKQRPEFVFGVAGKMRTYHLQPKDDMTVLELCKVTVLLNIGLLASARMAPPILVDQLFSTFPPEVQRHFEVHKQSQIIQPNGSVPVR